MKSYKWVHHLPQVKATARSPTAMYPAFIYPFIHDVPQEERTSRDAVSVAKIWCPTSYYTMWEYRTPGREDRGGEIDGEIAHQGCSVRKTGRESPGSRRHHQVPFAARKAHGTKLYRNRATAVCRVACFLACVLICLLMMTMMCGHCAVRFL